MKPIPETQLKTLEDKRKNVIVSRKFCAE